MFVAGDGRLFTFYCSPVHNALLVLLTKLTIFNSFNGGPYKVLVLFSFLSILHLDFPPIRMYENESRLRFIEQTVFWQISESPENHFKCFMLNIGLNFSAIM